MIAIEETGTPIGSYAPDFEVPGVDGGVHHLARYIETYRVIGVIFMANQCPYVERLLDELKTLQDEGEPQGVTLVGINANSARKSPDESFERMKDFARSCQLNFPYLRDVTQDVARCFGAYQTPDIFLLNYEGRLCYRRQLSSEDEAVEGLMDDIRQAIANIVANRPVTVTTPERSVGSPIQWSS
ncbi:thioredoxin family protein [Roseofilum casamattae]|uniref:Thioredoxin family protein n=1 Tax=Roseofilum casamattae BLCC-M143 TaxID=3022442 RepID=A0ABT7BX06_9CYAN|nr:thioredoxin family protein [Roseofilum casamattae]MDJ1183352.1 thioredoxin family protein [Roseofilum casamattae BLCC-M143]